MLVNLIWSIAVVVFGVSISVQYRALSRIAFSRSLFITGMLFLLSFILTLTVPGGIVWTLFSIFQAAGWIFLLFMTYRSWLWIRSEKRKKLK